MLAPFYAFGMGLRGLVDVLVRDARWKHGCSEGRVSLAKVYDCSGLQVETDGSALSVYGLEEFSEYAVASTARPLLETGLSS